MRRSRSSSTTPGPRRPREVVRRFEMKSRRDEIAPMVERVLEAAAPAGLSTNQRDNLAVAAAEALANAAVHGNRLREDAPVNVVVRVRRGDSATIEVHDTGPGFDSSAVRDPTAPDRLLVAGGRGLYLMRRLVDELEYLPPGNTVRLVVHRKDEGEDDIEA